MTNPLVRIDLAQMGERLRAARSRAGLTQEQAARKLNLARTTLVALERGQRRLRIEELKSIAEVYAISTNEFFRNDSASISLVPRFRAIPGLDKKDADEAALLLNDLAAAQVQLEAILGIQFYPNYPPERPLGPGEIREQAEDLATEVRQRLGNGLSAIPDIVSLMELELGVRIFVRHLRSGSISGLFAYDEKLGACILLNKNHPRERRALTAAHELAHLIATRRQPDVVETRGRAQSREERFAVAFSFALLMPAALVRRRFADLQREGGPFSPRQLILLAHQLGVSEEALCRRLEELQLIPGGTWDSLRDRGFSGETVRRVLGDKAPEEADVVPPRLWFLAGEAHRRNLLSEGQIGRLLKVDRLQVRTMLDTLGVEDGNELEPLPAG